MKIQREKTLVKTLSWEDSSADGCKEGKLK